MTFNFGDIVSYESLVKDRITNNYFIQGYALVVEEYLSIGTVIIITSGDKTIVNWPRGKLKLVKKNTFNFEI